MDWLFNWWASLLINDTLLFWGIMIMVIPIWAVVHAVQVHKENQNFKRIREEERESQNHS